MLVSFCHLDPTKYSGVDMDLTQIADKLHVSAEVRSKASELLRIASIRRSLGNDTLGQPAVCLQLAAEAVGSPFDQVRAKGLAGGLGTSCA